ncbi:MAG: flippase-like domain-containing protein [Bacteroidales bacterium]|nr:flippase-like domain-containing protein [Bacteroidales bacterium]
MTKLNKLLNKLLRWLIIVFAFSFLIYEFFFKKDLSGALNLFVKEFESASFIASIASSVILMIVNWGIEALKWQLLISKSEKISFLQSFQAVFSGVTVSVFTPNRVGEFFGRVFILEKTNPLKGIFMTIIGSISQFTTTIFFGSIGLFFFLPSYIERSTPLNDYLYWIVAFVLIVINLFLFLFYFNVSILTPLTNRLMKSKWKGIKDYLKVFASYTSLELFKVLTLSMSRYLVFNIQFYIILSAFIPELALLDSLVITFVIYFIMTAIPTITLAELGIRGSVSIAVFRMYFYYSDIISGSWEIGVLSSTTLMWLINLALPALIGLIFVHKLKFFQKRNTKLV